MPQKRKCFVVLLAASALLALLCVLLGTGLRERSEQPISPHYALRTTRFYLGDTSVTVDLLAYQHGLRGAHTILSHRLKGPVGVFPGNDGWKVMFVERDQNNRGGGRVYVCADGNTRFDVTAFVEEVARTREVISPDAKFGIHFVFDGAESTKDGVLLRVEWWRSDVTPSTPSIPISWGDVWSSQPARSSEGK